MKYNFNNDKGTPEVFGFADGDESWEQLNNNTAQGLFKSDDFTSDVVVDATTGETQKSWLQAFEGRYPEDNTDGTNLSEMVAWVYSTDISGVDSDGEEYPTFTETFTGDGISPMFTLNRTPTEMGQVLINSVANTNYTISDNILRFNNTPSSNSIISVTYVAKYIDYNKALDEAKTYSTVTFNSSGHPVFDGTTTEYTVDSKEYRIAKFHDEFEDYFVKDSAIFYYIFTELFLMVDSRTKNAFPSFFVDGDGVKEKWSWMPYDMDTALGIDNQGQLSFTYSLEDTDLTDAGALVFNGQRSVLWNNLRQAFASDIASMYGNLRSGYLTYSNVEKMFEDHQAYWPESVFNEDAMYKYIWPLSHPTTTPDGEITNSTTIYLPMAQGSKKRQRQWWLYNRFQYMDSKYQTGDAINTYTNVVSFRAYQKANIEITPYIDLYCTARFGNTSAVSKRTKRLETAILECPIDTLNNTEIGIFSASQIAEIGDLSPLKIASVQMANATKLQHLKIGDSDPSYENGYITTIGLGSNKMLETLDMRNCPNLTTISGGFYDGLQKCTSLKEIYLDGTSISNLTLPNGGVIQTLHLPDTITILTIRNQPLITDFTIAYSDSFTGDGATTEFELDQTRTEITYVKLNGTVTEDYSYSNNVITFTTAPTDGAVIKVASSGTMPTNLRKLRVENSSSTVDTKAILMNMTNNLPIRLIGVDWTSQNDTETRAIFDKIQSMKGIDSTDAGLETSNAVVSGVISMDSIGTFENTQTFTGDGSVTEYDLSYVPESISSIIINDKQVTDYTLTSNTIVFSEAPSADSVITVNYIADLYESYTTFYPDLYLRIGGTIKFKCRYYAENGTTPLQCGVDEDGNPVYQIIVDEGGTAPDPTKKSYSESFEGDGTTTAFTLTNTPSTISTVYVNGTLKTADTDYTVSDNVITFTTAPENSSYILVNYVVGYIDIPVKAGDAQYTYTYIGWDNDNNSSLTNIHSNMSFVQTFQQTVNQYTVYFVNDDGTPLYEDTVYYGEQAVYAGTPNPPQKTNVDNPDEWTFTGWSVDVSSISGSTTAYATYASPISDTQITDDWSTILENANNRYTETFTGDGTTTQFTLAYTPTEIISVLVGGVQISDYEMSLNNIIFDTAPDQDASIAIKYRTRSSYEIGNYKELQLEDGNTITMQIVGINTDTLSDGSDTAQYSWISKELYPEKHEFNNKYVEGIGQYTYDQDTGIWTSNIAGKPFYNAIGTWTVTVSGSGTLTIRYRISSETTHDYGTIYVDGDAIAKKISGETTWAEKYVAVTDGQSIVVQAVYHKDINQDAGTDTLYLRFVPDQSISIKTTYEGTDEIPSEGAIGGFDGMNIYSYLQEDVKSNLPELLQNNIKSVIKYTKSLIEEKNDIVQYNNLTSNPYIWIPSLREFGFLSSSYETLGPSYNSVYYDVNSRCKAVSTNSSNSYYWLRSQYTDESIACVTSLGSDGGLSADVVAYFPIGFST